MKIKDIATKRVYSVEHGMPIDTALVLMEEHGIHHLPVLRNGDVVGMVSDRDILLAVGWKTAAERGLPGRGRRVAGPTLVEQIMSKPVISLNLTDSIAHAARVMVECKIGALPLLNEGHLVGLISETDVIKLCLPDRGSSDGASKLGREMVKDHMRSRVITVQPQDSLADAVHTLHTKDIRHLPVVVQVAEGEQTVVGIISDRDLRRAIGVSAVRDEQAQESGAFFLGPTRIMDIMTHVVHTISLDATIGEAVEQMIGRHIHALPVLSGPSLVGIITETDIVRAIARHEPDS